MLGIQGARKKLKQKKIKKQAWDPKKMDKNWEHTLGFTWKEGLVFARTSPTQKLLIVSHFKIKEEEGGPEKIVAVTGDGVNDAQVCFSLLIYTRNEIAVLFEKKNTTTHNRLLLLLTLVFAWVSLVLT